MTIPLNGKVMSKRKYFHRNPQLSSYQIYATNPGLCCILYFCIAFLYIHVLLRHVSGFESKVNALHQACQLSKLQSWFRPLLQACCEESLTGPMQSTLESLSYIRHITPLVKVSALKAKTFIFMNGRSCKCDIVGNTKLVILTK